MIVKIQINEYQSLIVQNQKKAASSLENVQHEDFGRISYSVLGRELEVREG
jgi:hypothetical protein